MKTMLATMVLVLSVVGQAQAMPQAAETATPSQTGAPQRIRLGGNVTRAKLVEQVQPVYPPLARQARIQGTVKLHVILATDGAVKQLDVLSGHPLLVQAALDAVRKWRYQPTLLNGEPVEVDTTIDVVFTLQDNPSAPPPPPPPPMDPQLRADILHFFEVIHLQEKSAESGRIIFESLRPMLLKSLPATPNRDKIIDAYMEKLLSLLKSGAYTERVAAAYAKYFSDEQIKGLTQFYQTPAGQHYNEVSPRLLGELNQVGQRMVLENISEIMKQLCSEYPELQGPSNICPDADPQKKSLLSAPKAPFAPAPVYPSESR